MVADVYGKYLMYGAKTQPKARDVHEIDITKGLILGFRGRENSVPDGYCTRLLNTVPRNDGSYAARPAFFEGPSFNASSDEDGTLFGSVPVGTFSDGGVLSVLDAYTGFNFITVYRTGFTKQTLASSDRRHYGNAAHYGNVSVIPYIQYVSGGFTTIKVGVLVVTFNPTALTMTVTATDLTTVFAHAAYVYRDPSDALSGYGRSFALSWKGRTFVLAGTGISYSGPLQPGVFSTGAGGGFIPLDTTAPITGAFVLQDVLYIATEAELFAMTYTTDPGRDRNIRTHTKVPIFGAAEYDNIGYFATQQGFYRIIAGQLSPTFIPSDQNYANPNVTGDTGTATYPLGSDSVFIPRIASINKIGDSVLIAGLGFNTDKRFGEPSGDKYIYPVFNSSTETWTEWKREGTKKGFFSPVNALPVFQGSLTPNYGFPVSHIMQVFGTNLTSVSTVMGNSQQLYANAQPFNSFHFGWDDGWVNTNPTFETDLSDWTAGAGLGWTRSSTQARKGTWSGRFIHNDVGQSTELKTGLKPASPGDFFKFDCWIYAETATKTVTVGIKSVDGGGAESQEGNTLKSCTIGQWTYVSVEAFIDNPSAVNVLGRINVVAPVNTQVFFVDEAYLRPGFIISPYCDVDLSRGQTGYSESEYMTVQSIRAYEILLQTGRLNFGSPLTWKRMHRNWMEVSLPGERLRVYDNPIWWNFYAPFIDESGIISFREQHHKRLGTWHPDSDTFHNQTPGFHLTQDEDDLLPTWNYDFLLLNHLPVVWFKMDELAGSVLVDASGNGNDGTVGTDITKGQLSLILEGTSFKTGTSVSSDENYAARVVMTPGPLNGTDRLTWGLWVKFDAATAYSGEYIGTIGVADFTWGALIVSGTFPNLTLTMSFNPSGFGDVPSLQLALDSSDLGTVPDDVFIVFTYNQGEHSLYLNGQLYISGLQPPQTSTVIDNMTQMLISGWTQTDASSNIQNAIRNTFVDDAFLIGKVLNADEIFQLYAAAQSDGLSPVTEVNYASRFTSAMLEFAWRYPLEQANSLDLTNLPKFDEVGIGRLFADVSEYKVSNVGI